MALFVEIAGHLPAREARGVWSNSTVVDVNGAWESRSSPKPILDHVADTVASRELAGKYALCCRKDAGAEYCRSSAWRLGRGRGRGRGRLLHGSGRWCIGDGKGTCCFSVRFCRVPSGTGVWRCGPRPMRPPIRGSQSPPRPRRSRGGPNRATATAETQRLPRGCTWTETQVTQHGRSSQCQQQNSVRCCSTHQFIARATFILPAISILHPPSSILPFIRDQQEKDRLGSGYLSRQMLARSLSNTNTKATQ